VTPAWTHVVRLVEVARGPTTVSLGPDEATRARIAKELGLVSLPSLSAKLTLKAWMDGVEITGRFDAVVEQTSAVSLEDFQHPLSGEVEVRAVPAGSPNAQAAEGGEIDYDPEAPDPPDILEGDTIDLAAYVIEHLALEIDPFARQPGEEFDFQPLSEPESPFAVLKKLKDGES
jgi:uncharacterized metal-binding protein YceD (DUF177 family)